MPLPRLAQVIWWGRRPVDFVDWAARRYGDVFTIRFIRGRSLTYINRPEAARDLAGLRADEFVAGAESRDLLEPFLGPASLLVLDGDEHAKVRKVLVRAFHAETLVEHERVMLDAAQQLVGEWPMGAPVAVHPQMQALTLEIILRVIFGVDGDDLDSLRTVLGEMLVLGDSLWILFEPFRTLPGVRATWRRFTDARAQMDAAIVDLVRARRRAADSDVRIDVLSALAAARDEQGDLLPEPLVRDQLITLLFAGHDTTATALAWIFDLLAHHPAVADRLARELDGGDDAYLDAVIKEGLRLRPIVPELARRVLDSRTIGGRPVAAGTTVAVSTALVHRRPELYPEPGVFRPERFVDRAPDPYSWFPFGFGLRRCLGFAFANLEMRSVLRTVVPSFRFAPVRDAPERPRRRAVTLVPRHGAGIVLTPRV